jgi:hypothetical protein
MQMGNEKVVFSVAGIVRSAPEESSIKYNALIPFSNAKYIFSERAMKGLVQCKFRNLCFA